MSGTAPNGNDANGLLAGISTKLIRALPPAMIVLVVLNAAFIGIEAYRTGQRNELLTKIVESCLLQQRERSP